MKMNKTDYVRDKLEIKKCFRNGITSNYARAFPRLKGHMHVTLEWTGLGYGYHNVILVTRLNSDVTCGVDEYEWRKDKELFERMEAAL